MNGILDRASEMQRKHAGTHPSILLDNDRVAYLQFDCVELTELDMLIFFDVPSTQTERALLRVKLDFLNANFQPHLDAE
jgi:hypothetical protein